MKIISIILARGGSKEIPKKNIINLNDKPLIYYTIKQSQLSNVQETWISTDDKQIKKISLKYGAKVIDRPKELALDNSKPEEALLHFTENVEFDILVFVQCTSPLLLYTDINKGIEMILSEEYDSIFSAYKQHFLPEWSLNLKPLNWNKNNCKGQQYPRRQDMEEKLIDVGAFWVIKRDNFLKNGFRLEKRIGYVEVPLYRSFQVDTYEDLELIRKLMK